MGTVALVSVGACADNLVMNPGFEVDGDIVSIWNPATGHISNWSDFVANLTGGWVGTSTGAGRSGYGLTQNTGVTSSADSVAVIWQTIEITSGWIVDVSAWARASRAQGDSVIAVWNTASVVTLTAANYETYDYASGDVADQGLDTWHQLTIPSFTSNGYVTIASITDGYGYNDTYEVNLGPNTSFDDWSVTAVVPEPATMVVVAMGSVALLRRSRR